METYKEKFDKIAESVYNRIMEIAQQQVPTAPAAPAEPAAAPVDPAMAAQPAPGQQTEQGTEEGGVDEVGMSEIQELAGQLAQMLRDFKESNPDEFTEAAKFAAGMVVSAAVKGLKYRDRKDILKKIKAGETEQAEGEETSQEAQPAEQPEQMVAERLRKDDSRDAEDNRKELKPKEKKNIRSKKSPFSGVNEENGEVQTQLVGPNATAEDIQQGEENAVRNNASGILYKYTGENGTNNTLTSFKGDTNTTLSHIKGFNNSYVDLEEVKLTKRQFEMIRLHESKPKMVRFKKGQLDEAMKG